MKGGFRLYVSPSSGKRYISKVQCESHSLLLVLQRFEKDSDASATTFCRMMNSDVRTGRRERPSERDLIRNQMGGGKEFDSFLKYWVGFPYPPKESLLTFPLLIH